MLRYETGDLAATTTCASVVIWPSEQGMPLQQNNSCQAGLDVVAEFTYLRQHYPDNWPLERMIMRADASHRSVDVVPDLSLWPLSDPAETSYRLQHLYGADGTAEELGFRVPRERIGAMQERLNSTVLALAGLGALMACLIAAVVWFATGLVLRPVEAIRREVADITERDLSRRVPVPRARNEIAELARTVNATLDRLEVAVEDNRRFVADASHELRSPIAALRAELEIATAHPGQADWPAVVDAALADTHRLQHLATDLLLLARLDHTTGHDDTIDLTELVDDHTTRRRTHHTLTTELPDHPVPVRGSHALLDRLLGNLLDNAERHATTAITVRLTSSSQAVLEVHDDGPGIPPEDRERIFDRFTRLDDARTRDTGGTGLGLPIARRIAANHHGTLHAEGGPGARLVARIPLAD
ncbi:HAMP domain-containing histidine kinase [Saccharothrix syringae]|uniref:histidine kinase n=2 Tax=Saccharothrix syringae TaxID=103733 RepID=A0A5Q0HE83_SACSY|nr:HAMP domain-containing histidine kinase [Saccharothrix syringae]